MTDEYDISDHLPQQIEYFLNGLSSGNIEVLETTKNNIMDIFRNMDEDGVVLSIESWDKKKNDKIKDIWEKALESIKTVAETKNKEELFIDIDEIKKDVAIALNTLENEYWNSIRALLLKNVTK